jgi:hypothetical protein
MPDAGEVFGKALYGRYLRRAEGIYDKEAVSQRWEQLTEHEKDAYRWMPPEPPEEY